MGSVKRVVSTLTSLVATRLELLANELQEERLRLMQMLLYYLFAVFYFGMGLLLFTTLIVVIYWDEHRLAVLGILSLMFFALGVLVTILLRKKSQHSESKLFSQSLAEMSRDMEQLRVDHE